MSLFEELIEDREEDEKIVKSFQPKDTLSNQIFDESDDSYIMRGDIRKRILQISEDFTESLGVDFFIHDIVLTGSLANYNWSQYSDVDLHILIDFEESKYPADLLKEFFDAKERVFNKKYNIKIKGYDVEIYVQDINQEHVSSGVYSILNNEWVIKPDMTNPKIDDSKIIQKGEEYAKKIDELVSKFKSNKDVANETTSLYKKIKSFRQSGLESGGEYSYENLTFKLLRRNGYIEKLLKLKTDITDKKLSLTQ
jgi:predicted nucleotidyltransferase